MTGTGWIIWALAAFAPTPTAPPPSVPAALAPYGDVEIVWYDVEGRDARQVRRSIDAHRPVEPRSGERFDGLTNFDYHASWRGMEGGMCRSAPEDFVYTIKVHLPRLADQRAPARLRDSFGRYLETLAAHEAEHVKLALENLAALQQAMASAPCDDVVGIMDRINGDYAKRQLRLDEVTDHGKTSITPLR